MARINVAVLLLFISMPGCQDKPAPANAAKAPANAAKAPEVPKQEQYAPNEYATQRFVPLSEVPGAPIIKGVPRPYIALDTMSGNLCKTWDWNYRDSELNDLLTCDLLFRQFPKKVGQ